MQVTRGFCDNNLIRLMTPALRFPGCRCIYLQQSVDHHDHHREQPEGTKFNDSGSEHVFQDMHLKVKERWTWNQNTWILNLPVLCAHGKVTEGRKFWAALFPASASLSANDIYPSNSQDFILIAKWDNLREDALKSIQYDINFKVLLLKFL